MKRIAFCPLALLLLAACPKVDAPTPPDTSGQDEVARQAAAAAYSAFEARFFDEWFAQAPVTATVLGVHSGDAKWPDLSAEGRAASAKWVDEMLSEAGRIDALAEAGASHAG